MRMGGEQFSWDEVDGRFAEQMRLACLTPSHRIAIAVSGGADSIALCLLIARWKRWTVQREGFGEQGSGELLAYVVDHSLRKNSAEEALLVKESVCNLGLNCGVLKCTWPKGKPSSGHLQEAARTGRYSLLSQACHQSGVQALLTAHHADDQAELFILRLSRRSEIAGLAGMAFVADLHPTLLTVKCCTLSSLVLVRPLLKFTKPELYGICQQSNQAWVEDPTNVNLTFARNRIRKALQEPQYLLLKKELPKLIEFCRKMRFSIDKDRDSLLRDVAQVSQDFGSVTVDVQKLTTRGTSDVVTHRAVAAILQFVGQRAKPPRGRAVDMLLDRLRLGRLQGACTLGGCYVFPLSGSKGSRAVFCFSPHSPPPSGQLEATKQHSDPSLSRESCYWDEVDIPLFTERNSVPGAAESVLVGETSLTGVATEALRMKRPPRNVKDFKLLGLISEEGAALLDKLTSDIAIDRAKSSVDQTTEIPCLSSAVCDRMFGRISSGESLYFMDRFWVSLNFEGADFDTSESCSLLRERSSLYVRHFEDRDWDYLFDLVRGRTHKWVQACNFACSVLTGNVPRTHPDCERRQCKFSQGQQTGGLTKPLTGISPYQIPQKSIHAPGYNRDTFAHLESIQMAACDSHKLSRAKEALKMLRSIPKPIRRSLPVLTTAQGLLLGFPFAGFAHCKVMSFTARFCPRNRLGGGRASWR